MFLPPVKKKFRFQPYNMKILHKTHLQYKDSPQNTPTPFRRWRGMPLCNYFYFYFFKTWHVCNGRWCGTPLCNYFNFNFL